MTVHPLKVPVALGAVYLIWGTSYFAIGKGVETANPFLFCGLRFLLAAPLMLIAGSMNEHYVYYS